MNVWAAAGAHPNQSSWNILCILYTVIPTLFMIGPTLLVHRLEHLRHQVVVSMTTIPQ